MNLGSIMATLELNITNFNNNLKLAQSQVKATADKFSAISSAGDSLTSIGNTLTKSVTLPVTALGTACVKTAANFESAMSKVQAISGATGSDMDKLKAKAQEMGAKTKFSATESAEAFQYMAMAGWDTSEMLDGIEGIMNLAAASGEDLASVSDIVTDSLTAFGLSANDTGHYVDILAMASNASNTDVAMLGESFKYVAPVCGALGMSAEDTAVALGLMANSGIKSSQAGTTLRTALTRLVKPTDEMEVAMKKYGISLTNSDGSVKSLSEVMEMLRSKMGKMDKATQTQIATTLFGKEAMSGMLSIINASEEDYNSLTSAINNCDGTAQNMADTMLNNLNGQLTILKSTVESIAISIGNILLPYIKQFTSWLQKLADKINNSTKEQQEFAVKIALVAAAIGPVLIAVGKMISGFVKLKTAITTIKAGFTVLQGVLAGISAPVLAVVAVVAALAAAFVYLWKTNEDFRNNIIAIWNDIVAKVKPLISSIAEHFGIILEKLQPVAEFLISTLEPIFEGVFNQIGNLVTTFLGILDGLITFITGVFTGNWSMAWEGIKQIFSSVLEGIKGTFESWWIAITGVLNKYLGLMGTSITGVWDSITSYLSGIWQGICTTCTTIWNGIYETLSTIISSIVNFVTSSFNSVLSSISSILGEIKTVFSTAWNFIKTLVLGIVLIICDAVSGNFTNLKSDAIKIFNSLKTSLSGIWQGIKTVISNVVNAIKTFCSAAWTTLKTNAVNTFNSMKTSISSSMNNLKSSVTKAWTNIKTSVSTTVTNIKTNAIKTFQTMRTAISSTVNGIKNAIVNGFKSAVKYITSLPSQAKKWGSDIIQGIVNGIKSKMNDVASAASSVASKIRSYLHFSVPDEGPLTDYETYMPDFMQGLATTMKKAAPTLLKQTEAVASMLSNAIQPDLAAASSGITGFYGNGRAIAGNTTTNNSYGGNVTIENITVRNDNDLSVLTQGLYDKTSSTNRALGIKKISS